MGNRNGSRFGVVVRGAVGQISLTGPAGQICAGSAVRGSFVGAGLFTAAEHVLTIRIS
jgi:hypothetical protein